MCGTSLPSTKLDFRRNCIWTIPHIYGAHCLHTHQISRKYFDLGQIYDIRADIFPKTKFEMGPLAAEFYFRFQVDKCHLLGTFLCMIQQNFKKIAQCAAELCAILLFLYLPLNLHCQWHNHTVPSCRPSIHGSCIGSK